MSRCPLVMIEWEDSAQPTSEWAFLASLEPSSIIRCASVGWLIHDGPEMKALAPNMGNLEDEDGVQVSGVIRIPARSVIRIVEIVEPALVTTSAASSCDAVPSSHPDPEPSLRGS